MGNIDVENNATKEGSLHKPDGAEEDVRLDHLGIDSPLERNFSLPSLIALCVCLMGTWEAGSAVLKQALASGGAPCLFYNLYVLVSFVYSYKKKSRTNDICVSILTIVCTLAIGASLAEIASIYPTAGGE